MRPTPLPGALLPGLLLALLLAGLLLLAACRGDGTGDPLPVSVQLSVAPTPPVVGPALVVVEIRHPGGDPVDGAEVMVEGTMTHAGMVPEREPAIPTEGGRYRIPEFPFSMGGDWILRVHLRLPDGTEGVHEESVRVISAPERDGEDAAGTP